jgi:hypothetical protein
LADFAIAFALLLGMLILFTIARALAIGPWLSALNGGIEMSSTRSLSC